MLILLSVVRIDACSEEQTGGRQGKDVVDGVLLPDASFSKGRLCIIHRISAKAADTEDIQDHQNKYI